MGDWLLNLPVLWMAVVVFVATYLITACVYLVVTRLAVNERAKVFKAVSPGMLPHWASFSPCWLALLPSRCGVISTKPRVQLRLRQAHFGLSFYSPERSPRNRGHASTISSTVTSRMQSSENGQQWRSSM